MDKGLPLRIPNLGVLDLFYFWLKIIHFTWTSIYHIGSSRNARQICCMHTIVVLSHERRNIGDWFLILTVRYFAKSCGVKPSLPPEFIQLPNSNVTMLGSLNHLSQQLYMCFARDLVRVQGTGHCRIWQRYIWLFSTQQWLFSGYAPQ